MSAIGGLGDGLGGGLGVEGYPLASRVNAIDPYGITGCLYILKLL